MDEPTKVIAPSMIEWVRIWLVELQRTTAARFRLDDVPTVLRLLKQSNQHEEANWIEANQDAWREGTRTGFISVGRTNK